MDREEALKIQEEFESKYENTLKDDLHNMMVFSQWSGLGYLITHGIFDGKHDEFMLYVKPRMDIMKWIFGLGSDIKEHQHKFTFDDTFFKNLIVSFHIGYKVRCNYNREKSTLNDVHLDIVILRKAIEYYQIEQIGLIQCMIRYALSEAYKVYLDNVEKISYKEYNKYINSYTDNDFYEQISRYNDLLNEYDELKYLPNIEKKIKRILRGVNPSYSKVKIGELINLIRNIDACQNYVKVNALVDNIHNISEENKKKLVQAYNSFYHKQYGFDKVKDKIVKDIIDFRHEFTNTYLEVYGYFYDMEVEINGSLPFDPTMEYT